MNTFISNSKITALLYRLMRDEVVPGKMETIIEQIKDSNKWEFTNGYLAQYAENLKNRLEE